MNKDDPLIARLELITHLLKQFELPRDSKVLIENDLQILNTFALAKDWEKVKLLIEKWTEKLRDATQVQIIICKWNISMEVAVDGSDFEFLQLLLPLVGKHKKLRIKLPFIAIALEKQDETLTELMIKYLYLDKEENSILARLPKDDERAYQALFNRYCCISDMEIIKELLEEFKKNEISDLDAKEIATEHRLAMITFLCKHSNISVSEDTIWNCINSGNFHISKLLETLKDISAIGWMETFETAETTDSRIESGARPNTPLYHTSNGKNPSDQDDEQFSSLLALYSAYGGNISGIDTETREKFSIMNPPDSPRSYSGYLSRKGAPKRFRCASTVPCEAAIKVVQSKQDDYWTKYLNGEIQEISALPWMEPSNDVKTNNIWSQNDFGIAEDPENAIFEGLAGVASRTSSTRRKGREESSYSIAVTQ